MYPQILYWKWNDGILEGDTVVTKTNDIIQRSIFTHIYISTHPIKNMKNKKFTNPKMRNAIIKCNELFRNNGRKVIWDVDVKYLNETFFEINQTDLATLNKRYEIKLNDEGFGCFDIPYQETDKYYIDRDDLIFGAWSLKKITNCSYRENSLNEISDCIRYENGKIIVETSKENSGNTAIIMLKIKTNKPDFFCKDYMIAQKRVFDDLKDIELGGIATDELGLLIDLSKVDLDTPCYYADLMYLSNGLNDRFVEFNGGDLIDQLLNYYYYPDDNKQITIDIINNYIKTIRKTCVEYDNQIYDWGKEYFGEDTFIGCHPTWWGTWNELNLECLNNGFDWWEVKRDFSQTDEEVIMPLRLSMQRNCPEPVWYNMWYSMRTMDIDTYYKETWTNARYGGRTTHLGYECYEEGVVLTLWQEGRLESISEMEKEIAKLNEFTASKPDSRVLIVFGMESFTNRVLTTPEELEYKNQGNNDKEILTFAKELFDYPYLCDLLPTSEIDNEKLKIENNKAVYCGHDYDAVILIHPEGMSKKAEEFFAEYSDCNNNFIVIGEYQSIKYQFNYGTKAEIIADLLINLGIKQNATVNSTVFEDGAVVFTTDGKLNKNNKLVVSQEVDGHLIEFEGKDFLAINISEAGEIKDIKFGSKEKLLIDGKEACLEVDKMV